MFLEIGAAIAAERVRLGLRASELGVAAEVVEAIEAGRPGLTTTQLEAIAAALQLDPVALRAGEIKPRPQPSVFLLHRGTQDFAAADGRALDDALENARTRNTLARLLGDKLGIFPAHRVAARGVAADTSNAPAHQGYQLARELRRALDPEPDALGDMRALAEDACGVAVVVRRLATIGSSAFAVKSGDAAAIVLAPSARDREPYARVWIAHELCHLLYDPDGGGVHVVVDFESDRRTLQAEQRARAFAAELLLPEAGLRRLIGVPTNIAGENASRQLVAMVRDTFGTTWPLAANHLCNLGFIAANLRPWLERQQAPALTRTWSTTLPAPGEPSLHVAALVRRAYDAGHLTDGEVRGILDLDVLAPLPWDRG